MRYTEHTEHTESAAKSARTVEPKKTRLGQRVGLVAGYEVQSSVRVYRDPSSSVSLSGMMGLISARTRSAKALVPAGS